MDRVPVGLGVGLGVAAYVVNYVILGLFVFIDSDSTENILTGIGFYFYNAHNVPVESTATVAGVSRSSTRNLLQAIAASPMTDTTIPVVLYYVVPAVVLLGLGVALGRRSAVGGRGGSAADGFLGGASMLVGYLVLAVLGTFLFSTSVGGASTSPALMQSALFMGIAYPLVLGGIGGVVGYVTSQ